MRVFLLADRGLERDRLLRDLQDLAHLADRDVHALRDLVAGRLATQLLDERAAGADQLVDRLDHVHGMRMVRAWSAIARVIAWRIHHVA
jgi:hypothetical protein